MYKLTELDTQLKQDVKEVARAQKHGDIKKTQDAYDNLVLNCLKRDILIYTDFETGRVIDSFDVKACPVTGTPLVWTKTHIECLEELCDTDMNVIEYITILMEMGRN